MPIPARMEAGRRAEDANLRTVADAGRFRGLHDLGDARLHAVASDRVETPGLRLPIGGARREHRPPRLMGTARDDPPAREAGLWLYRGTNPTLFNGYDAFFRTEGILCRVMDGGDPTYAEDVGAFRAVQEHVREEPYSKKSSYLSWSQSSDVA